MTKLKYMWTTKDFEDWVKLQSQELKKLGLDAGTANTAQLLLEKVIKPNNIELKDVFRDIKINNRNRRGLI